LFRTVLTRLRSRPFGPRVVVMSLMKPVPGTNQRSIVIEMGQGCSQRRWNARNFPAGSTTSFSPTTVNC
jgi:hypothetical protein